MVSDLTTDSKILFDYTWLSRQESPETPSNKHQKARPYFWLTAVTHTHTQTHIHTRARARTFIKAVPVIEHQRTFTVIHHTRKKYNKTRLSFVIYNIFLSVFGYLSLSLDKIKNMTRRSDYFMCYHV